MANCQICARSGNVVLRFPDIPSRYHTTRGSVTEDTLIGRVDCGCISCLACSYKVTKQSGASTFLCPSCRHYLIVPRDAEVMLDTLHDWLEESTATSYFAQEPAKSSQQTDVGKCDKCGSYEFEYDSYWNEYTCNKCGWIKSA